MKELTIIENHFKQLKESGVKLIPDGIVNKEMYQNARLKILWILKEPDDNSGTSWDMRDFLKSPRNLTVRDDNWNWKRTYKMIMLVSWGILNNFQSYEKTLSDWENQGNEKTLWVLNEIAFINLKKTGGASNSYPPTIRNAYNKFKELIWLQINTFKPDIAICGGTYEFINKDISQYCTENIQFVNNYHPNFRRGKNHMVYYNEILEEAKKHTNNS
ncbi:MAG: hypothetical protein PHT69_16070 [Bacteroidales bacterium]|nr:hypothetical protein [Bacteroidales bacterium]